MNIGKPIEGYPVPNISFEGRMVFVEIKPGDTEGFMQKLVAKVSKMLKYYADNKPGVVFTKKINSSIIQKTRIGRN